MAEPLEPPSPYWVSDEGDVVLHLGDCLAVLPSLPDCSIDAIVTDPPYGLEFMGREWDTFKPSAARIRPPSEADQSSDRAHNASTSLVARNAPEGYVAGRPFQRWCEAWAAECLRVLKPGGHLLAFGGTRTWHRMACGIEDAGFDIRDSIDWLYGTGFPKNEACLKPAHEPIVMARKPARRSEPLPGLRGCMVAHASAADLEASRAKNPGRDDLFTSDTYGADRPQQRVNDAGRWPPNVVLGPAAAEELDWQSGISTSSGGRIGNKDGGQIYGGGKGLAGAYSAGDPGFGDVGGASRFFPVFKYEPKAPASERPRLPDGTVWPTVKPLDLMRWLVRLVTPPGGTVLDLFGGSGTTAEACVVEGFRCVLIDKDPVAAKLIKARLSKPIQPVMFGLEAS